MLRQSGSCHLPKMNGLLSSSLIQMISAQRSHKTHGENIKKKKSNLEQHHNPRLETTEVRAFRTQIKDISINKAGCQGQGFWASREQNKA